MARVLVACEFSGIVRDAFIQAGHQAISVDLLPSERLGPHLQRDVLTLHAKYLATFDLMIAHPPCTYLTNAGVRHLSSVPSKHGSVAKVHGDARWQAMYAACEFFNALKDFPIPHIAIENPLPHGYAREIIGEYDQIVQPWWFGDPEQKRTCWWLKSLPLLWHTDVIREGVLPYSHYLPPEAERWKERSRFFPGMARAMAKQWGDFIASP